MILCHTKLEKRKTQYILLPSEVLLQINAYLVLAAGCTRYAIDLGQYMSNSLFNNWPKVRHIKEAPKDYDPSAPKNYSKWSPDRPYFVTLEGGKVSLYVDRQMLKDIMKDYESDLKRVIREKKCTYFNNGRFNRCNKDCMQCELYLYGYASLAKSYGGSFSVDAMNDDSGKEDDDRLYELPDEDYVNPLDKMIKEERASIIRGAIKSLEEKYQKVIQYTYYENLNPTDIERKYKIARKTVTDRLEKAKKLVKEILENYEEFKNK